MPGRRTRRFLGGARAGKSTPAAAIAIAEDLALRDADVDDDKPGLILPSDVEAERRREKLTAIAKEKIAERSKGEKADRLVRRDGKVRKGAHTQSAMRARARRKHGGLKGIVGS